MLKQVCLKDLTKLENHMQKGKFSDEIDVFCSYDNDMIYSSSSSALPFFVNSFL